MFRPFNGMIFPCLLNNALFPHSSTVSAACEFANGEPKGWNLLARLLLLFLGTGSCFLSIRSLWYFFWYVASHICPRCPSALFHLWMLIGNSCSSISEYIFLSLRIIGQSTKGWFRHAFLFCFSCIKWSRTSMNSQETRPYWCNPWLSTNPFLKPDFVGWWSQTFHQQKTSIWTPRMPWKRQKLQLMYVLPHQHCGDGPLVFQMARCTWQLNGELLAV